MTVRRSISAGAPASKLPFVIATVLSTLHAAIIMRPVARVAIAYFRRFAALKRQNDPVPVDYRHCLSKGPEERSADKLVEDLIQRDLEVDAHNVAQETLS